MYILVSDCNYNSHIGVQASYNKGLMLMSQSTGVCSLVQMGHHPFFHKKIKESV